jgi:hypothetical protein
MKRSLLATPAVHAELDYLSLARMAQTAYGDWLNERDWHHFLHLTFRYSVSGEMAARRFRVWETRLKRDAGLELSWFYAAERKADGLIHIHALVHGSAQAGGQVLRSAWVNGFSKVSVYEPSRGAAHYVTKEIWRNIDWYDFEFRS